MQKRKKMLIVTKNYGYDFTGATLATQTFVSRWCKEYDVQVYTINIGNIYISDNIKVNKFNSVLSLVYGLYKSKCKNINTVYYSDDHLGAVLPILGINYYHTYHGNWPDAAKLNASMFLKSLFFMPLYYLTIRYATCVVSVSSYMADYIRRINKNNIVIHNGMDEKKIKNTEKRNSCVMVGNVDERKYKYLIHLLKACKQKKINIKIDIYGRIEDEKIARKIKEYDNVNFIGLVKNVPYYKYKLFINLSVMENLSISVCESIRYGVPVVCFDVGGLSEVVKSGRTGEIIKPYDVDKMAETIVMMMHNDIVVDKSVLRDFDWDVASKRYMDMFIKGVINA